MTDNLRDQIAAALEDAAWYSTAARADAVMPVVQAAIREARREAWNEGHADGQDNEHEFRPGKKIINPYAAGEHDTPATKPTAEDAVEALKVLGQHGLLTGGLSDLRDLLAEVIADDQPATSSGVEAAAHPCGDYPAPCNCDDPVTHDGQTAEHGIDTARMRACAPLLPPPGDEVVRDLCDALDRQREETARLRAKLEEWRDARTPSRIMGDDARARLDEIRAALGEQDDQWRNGLVRRIRTILDRNG